MSEEIRVHDSITQAAVNAGSPQTPSVAVEPVPAKKAAPVKAAKKAAPVKAVVAKAQTAEVKGSVSDK